MVNWIASAAPRVGLIGMVVALGLCANPSFAQDTRVESLVNRLDRLERDLGTLSRQVYRGDAPKGAPAASGGNGPVMAGDYAARLESRISVMESQLTQMTGTLETLTHSNSELAARLDLMAKDNELRFHELEAGGTARPTAQQGGPAGPASRESTLGTLNQADLAVPPAKDGVAAPAPAPAQQQQVSLPQGSPQQQYDYAWGMLSKARSDAEYANASRAFQAFLEKNPSGPLASNAHYWMGETYYVRKDYNGAARVFLDGYQKDQKGNKAPDMLLKLGMSLTYLDKKKEACATFDKLARDFPDASTNIKRLLPAERKRAGCA